MRIFGEDKKPRREDCIQATGFVKNPRLKSRASDKKQKPLFVGLRLAFICFLLHLPDALPAGFSLTQALRRLPSYAGPPTVQALSGLSPRLPRFPEVPLLRYLVISVSGVLVYM